MSTRSAAGRGAGRRGPRSALTTVVRSITVAAGAFAPGHLGELTRQVPFELVDSVLVQRRATERRLRALPSAGSAPVARHVIVDDSIGRPG